MLSAQFWMTLATGVEYLRLASSQGELQDMQIEASDKRPVSTDD